MQWIIEKNIDHFQKLIARETDPQKLAVLHELLIEQKSKLAALQAETRQ